MRAIMILCVLLMGIFSMTSSAEEDTWARKANMPTMRRGLSTSAVDGTIYAIGGAIDPADNVWVLCKLVEAYDPVTDTWIKKADMPTARCGFSTSVVDGVIYAIGGMLDTNTPAVSTVEAYDPATDTWTQKADMPTARVWLSTSVVDGIIYAIGGGGRWLENVNFAAVEAYNPATDTWVKKADMPTSRGGLSTSAVDGIIYAISGWGGVARPDGVQIPTVEAYDPKTDTWTQKEDIPTARYWLSTGVVDGIIYAIGGYIGDTNRVLVIPTVEAYNPAKDKWTKKADMPTARCAFGASVVNRKIYAIGGWVPNAPLKVVEEYDPGTNPPVGKAVEPRGKFTTTWAAIKHQ